ncbi:hypothetical protein K457DRAFT_159947 [Linnemannia elongata AG-77]|uniref:Uncharacterized protein n=1 Tax=Linnemannia elongata AG-77 TaxID=1314771 RepID=A0A197JCT2_9FUNG|nr:hypothetical protein K457DRAFT_159947 [Linnemannia elongata AG-77]
MGILGTIDYNYLDRYPEYTSTVVCELSVNVDIVYLFENIPESFDILMEVTPYGIRRKVAKSYPPKSIDRKYIRPTIISRPIIRNKYVVITNASDEYTVVTTVAILSKLLLLYENICGDVYATLSGLVTIPAERPKRVKAPGKTKIEDLRKRLPELFTSNYTRECHRLPLMLEGKEKARECMNAGRMVIKYPKTGPHARWYTSPNPELYVGLKVNRLVNKDAFKYIVVCYTSNHLVNPSKRTYQYYYNEDTPLETKHMEDIKTLKALGVGRRGPIPHVMEAEYGVQGYKRLGVGDAAMGEKDVRRAIRDHPELLHVIGQDSAGLPMETELQDGVVDHRGKYKLCIPRKDYIWETCNRYESYVLVLKNIRRLYSNVSITYELIIRDDTYVHHRDDDLVSKLVATKLESTVRPYYSSKIKQSRIRYQHLDEEGRYGGRMRHTAILLRRNGERSCVVKM